MSSNERVGADAVCFESGSALCGEGVGCTRAVAAGGGEATSAECCVSSSAQCNTISAVEGDGEVVAEWGLAEALLGESREGEAVRCDRMTAVVAASNSYSSLL
jgi:hypothetical protein